MKRFKIAIVAIIVILVLVLILQNLTTVDTKLLFVTVSMPRAVLLLVVFGLGFVSGLLGRLSTREKPGP